LSELFIFYYTQVCKVCYVNSEKKFHKTKTSQYQYQYQSLRNISAFRNTVELSPNYFGKNAGSVFQKIFRKSTIEIISQYFAAYNFYSGYGNKFLILSFFLTPVPTQNLWISFFRTFDLYSLATKLWCTYITWIKILQFNGKRL
jgi:hypothetical protein